jgi:protein tyrosine/serine phosphatase
MPSRQVRFEGMVNFRDLGGLPVGSRGQVRTGRLFRSDSVAYASTVDVKRLLDEFGVRAVIDLRGEKEVARLGRGPLAGAAIRYLPAPITDIEAAEQVAYYLAMLEQRGPLLVSLLRELTDPAVLPAVFHCEAGCDRTGVLAAALLGLLGVADEDICADYALTAPAMPFIGARVRAALLALDPTLSFDPDEEPWLPTEATMAATLAGVRDRWGSIVGWARAYGLTEHELSTLREALVEY